jgi:hypothetical protein
MNVILGLPELVIELRKLSLQLKNSNQAYSLGKADAFSGCADSIEARLAAQAQAIESDPPHDYNLGFIDGAHAMEPRIEQAKLQARLSLMDDLLLEEENIEDESGGWHIVRTSIIEKRIKQDKKALAALRSASEPRAVQDSKP